MDTDKHRWDENEITERIIGASFRVQNVLRSGFLEKVYENALAHELRKAGLQVTQQSSMQVWYDGIVVGEYYADLLVEGQVIVELKVAKALDSIHTAQCLHYLKATNVKLGLL